MLITSRSFSLTTASTTCLSNNSKCIYSRLTLLLQQCCSSILTLKELWCLSECVSLFSKMNTISTRWACFSKIKLWTLSLFKCSIRCSNTTSRLKLCPLKCNISLLTSNLLQALSLSLINLFPKIFKFKGSYPISSLLHNQPCMSATNNLKLAIK